MTSESHEEIQGLDMIEDKNTVLQTLIQMIATTEIMTKKVIIAVAGTREMITVVGEEIMSEEVITMIAKMTK
jgi:hypothetical protein